MFVMHAQPAFISSPHRQAAADTLTLLKIIRPRIRTNGATQTFRRPSVATNPSHTRENSQATISTPSTTAHVPSHVTSNYQSSGIRNGGITENRYSKEQLLDVYRTLRESGILGKDLADYFVADWDPHVATSTANGAWGKRDEQRNSHPHSHHKDNHSGPEVCWDHGGQVEPLGLSDLTDDEKEVRVSFPPSLYFIFFLFYFLFLFFIFYFSSVCLMENMFSLANRDAVIFCVSEFSSEASTIQCL